MLGCAGVGHAGEHLFDAAHQHLAALLRQWRVQRKVKAAEFDGARHAQLVAQARNRDLELVVDHAHAGRLLGLEQGQRRAVAFARVDRHVHADRLQERCAVRAAGDHEGVRLERARLAAVAVTHAHLADFAAIAVQTLDVVTEHQPRAALAAQGGQLLRERARVARLVALGVGAAHNAIGKGPQCGLDGEQLAARHHPALDAKALHHGGGFGGAVKGFLIGVVVGDAALQPVVFDAGVGHHRLQRGVAV
ncbi:hypothetical protein D9M68_679600 [compost metagenome]